MTSLFKKICIYIYLFGCIGSELQPVGSWLHPVVSFLVVHGLSSGTQAQQLWHPGLAASGMWDPSSLTRDWTHAPCIGRRILNHWTTREVLRMAFFLQSSVGIFLSFSYNSSCLWPPITIPPKARWPAVTTVPSITNPDVWHHPQTLLLNAPAPWHVIPLLNSLQLPLLSTPCQQPDWLSWDYILAKGRLATCPVASPVSFFWVFSSLLCFFSFSCLGYNAAKHPGCWGQGPPLGRQCRSLEGACLLRTSREKKWYQLCDSGRTASSFLNLSFLVCKVGLSTSGPAGSQWRKNEIIYAQRPTGKNASKQKVVPYILWICFQTPNLYTPAGEDAQPSFTFSKGITP